MNAVGRQTHRSAAPVQYQRQYSDSSFDISSNNSKWLQSSASAASVHDLSSYSRMFRSMQQLSQRNHGDEDFVSSSELSSEILDLHSIDTELLSDGRSFDDLEPYFSTNKPINMPRGPPENNLLRSFSADKEKGSSVARIKVVVRKRPLNKKEISKKEEDIIMIEPSSNSLTVHETKLKVDLTEYVEKHEFFFDAVLDEKVSNEEVYRETVGPIVPIIFQRTKATCFAYGQTGSGKTYTMQPLPLKASQDILTLIQHTYRSQGFQLFVSFFEIYGGKLFDLLNDRRKLCMREDGKQQVCIVGLQEFRVSSVETIGELIEKGNATRSTGTTGANEESSRSHAILQLVIKRSVDDSESKPARIVGKLSFIDLAGSERGADTTDNDKQTRIEGAEINKSLLALKECIRALDNDQVHIPFRGSKLTEVLRDSFIGDSRTVMISCISPNSGSCEHTLNTLRYADRVKSLSKGSSSSKKDLLSSSLKDSIALPPSSSVLPTYTTIESDMVDISNEANRFGWSKKNWTEISLPFNPDHGLRGREDEHLSSAYANYPKEQKGIGHATGEEYDLSESYDQEKSSRMEGKSEPYPISSWQDKTKKVNIRTKWNDLPDLGVNNSHPDDDLNVLLKEEEDLVSAHRRQVEEMMDIVREEIKLLEEADQPGNQLDDYISKLNTILSQKAAGILNLQARLANFQRRLNEHNVLVS